MNVFVIWLGTIGFACLPPGPVALPYAGPFAMPPALAVRLAAANPALRVIAGDDARFDPGRCPPLY